MGGTGGRRACQASAECAGLTCCDGFCVNTANDVLNCGRCGNVCPGATPYCMGTTCAPNPPCTLVGATCPVGETCCGAACCTSGELCCTVTIGPTVTRCFTPVNGTCPTGCINCDCAAPDTPVATPRGERPISTLAVGDLIYSLHRGAMTALPIKLVHRQPVAQTHRVVVLALENGAKLRISPGHPTADGRRVGDIRVGDLLDGVRVLAATVAAYDHPFTYDLLPDSDSGSYVAAGVLVGSTLADPSRAQMSVDPGQLR